MQMHVLSFLDGFTTNKGKMGNTWMRRKTNNLLKSMVEVFENWSLMLVEYSDKVWTTNVRLKQKELIKMKSKFRCWKCSKYNLNTTEKKMKLDGEYEPI
jgi:hypothetical protein